MHSNTNRLRPVRWAAWALAAAGVLLWGAFFVEHLGWFLSHGLETPPLKVWLLQSCQLGLLVGYLLAFKWPRVGSAAIVTFALLFFPAVAGRNAVLFTSVSILPAVLLMVHWLANRPRTAAATVP